MQLYKDGVRDVACNWWGMMAMGSCDSEGHLVGIGVQSTNQQGDMRWQLQNEI
jgi:hypothetical protein